jgi:Dolichyl-phosphate-mannose-protein mannosyltransferase
VDLPDWSEETLPPVASRARPPEAPAPPPSRLWFGRWSSSTLVTYLLLGAITLIAAIPRFDNLGGPSFWNDEGTTSTLAVGILHHGLSALWTTPGATNIVDYDPLYPLVESWAFAIGGVSQFTARFPSALFGVLLVPLSFELGRRLRGPPTGLALAILTAFSTEYIAWSRQARGYMLFTFLLVLAVLIAERWAARRGNFLLNSAAFVGVTVLVLLASPGVGLLYAPGVVLGIAVGWASAHPAVFRSVLARVDGRAAPPAPGAGRWTRRRVAFLGVVLAIVLLVGLAVGGLLNPIFEAVFHFQPYPIVWVSFYGGYLLTYYAIAVGFGVIGMLLAIQRGRPLELAMLGFTLGSLLSLSTLLSLVANVAGGAPVYERYVTPLLVFLFYFAAVGLYATFRILARELRRRLPALGVPEWGVPVGQAMFVAAVILLPAAAFPALLTTYPSPGFSPNNSEVPWQPFEVLPPYPSAIYDTPQPNFELASDYVAAHEGPGDVVMAIWPDAPTFYLHHVQYWSYTDPPPGSTVRTSTGQLAYLLTGSIQVATAGEFEGIVQNSSGWFIEDTLSVGALGANLSLAISYLTTFVPAASDISISLYHWSQSSVPQMLETLQSHRPDLQAAFGTNTTELYDWAAVSGVTIDGLRPVLLPMEPTLVQLASPSAKPLAVLFNVYNSRPDLLSEYPQVLAGNYTALVGWAAGVVEGHIHDPAYSVLAPYASYYEHYS